MWHVIIVNSSTWLTLTHCGRCNLLRLPANWEKDSSFTPFITCMPYCPSRYDDVIMSAMASQITSLTIVYSTVYSCADQRKHQSYASLAFVWGIHRWPVNSPHKGPVRRKMFPFHGVIMVNPEWSLAYIYGPELGHHCACIWPNT